MQVLLGLVLAVLGVVVGTAAARRSRVDGLRQPLELRPALQTAAAMALLGVGLALALGSPVLGTVGVFFALVLSVLALVKARR